jgi:hypothetical protein
MCAKSGFVIVDQNGNFLKFRRQGQLSHKAAARKITCA